MRQNTEKSPEDLRRLAVNQAPVKEYLLTLLVFLKSLSDSKSPQVSRTLLSILADLSNI